VQNLPDQSAKPVSNYSNRLIVPQARYIPAIEDLEDASFIFNRSVGSLIEDAPHMTITLRGPVAAAYSRALVVSGAGQAPTHEERFPSEGKVAAVTPTSAMVCCAESTPRPGTSASRWT
jgi:hypothetical protein